MIIHRKASIMLTGSSAVIRLGCGLARLETSTGNLRSALRLAGAAGSLSSAVLNPAFSAQDPRLDPLWKLAGQALTPGEQAADWAAGQAMTLEEAIVYALNGTDS